MGSEAPLRVLSLDGGGIRGISSLLILEDVMEKLRDALNLDSTPRPCDFFDLIGGTSTGGIIAIMLGRLGMTVKECIQAYKEVAQQAFTPKRTTFLPASPAGAFSAKALEDAIKKMLRKFCAESECAAQRSQGLSTTETCPHSDVGYRHRSCTKTVVLAITKDNVDAGPTLFATYDMSARLDGCAVWEVARATSAATTFFKPIKVGCNSIEFVDAGFGYNNPCEVLVEEARRQFPGHGLLQVLSIGTGLGDVVSIGNTRLAIVKALKTMASSSKAAAARLNSQYGDSGQYYRFNVNQGLKDVTLSDWEKSSTISAHTHNYLNDINTKREIKKFVDGLAGTMPGSEAQVGRTAPATGSAAESGKDEAQEMAATLPRRVQRPEAQPGGASTDRPGIPWHYIPFTRNLRFVGRSKTLGKLQQMLFTQETCRKAAVVGLGGVGKSQVALQMAYWAKKHRPEYSIFWVSALSGATFEQAYTEMARMLPLGNVGADDEDPKDAVRRYLSSSAAGPWLLVVDNADDMDTVFGSPGGPGGLNKYLPESEDGVVLFTTRSREVAVSSAGGDVVELHEMDPGEAADYLERLLIRDDDVGTAELLKQLTYLPLAITQAAAYLNTTGVPMAEYLNLLRGADQEAASLMSREFHDSTRYEGSQNAVATTWIVSFDQIRRSDGTAADLLAFMSCIEPKAIPQSMLPRCELEEQMVHAIGTLCGYAFLTRRGNSKVFDMHSLVHLATRIWIQREGRVATTSEAVIRQVAAVFPNDDHVNRSLWREYLPHAFRVLQHCSEADMKEKYNLCYWVGRCLRVDGRIGEAVEYLEEAWRWRKSYFEEDHPSRLVSQHALAVAYRANGQVPAAVALLEQVVAIKARTLTEDHPDRLASQHELAIAYRANGQVPSAVALLEQVVAIRERVLAEDHPDRLASQHELASAYGANGQVLAAVALLEQVVAIKARTLAEDHPSRLVSQHELASAYRANGQVPAAVALLEQVVAIKARTLTEDHPSQLVSQHALAIAYRANGQVPAAVTLLEQVVAINKRVLAEDHPDRLASQHALAVAYRANRQVPAAVALLEQVVAIKARALAEDHPDRLTSQLELAVAYRANGQVPAAVALLEQVVAIKARVLAEDHPDRLASQQWLTYTLQGASSG